MRNRIVVSILAAGLAMVALGATAQRSDTNSAQTQNQAGMMGQMMMHNNQMSDLMNQLMQSMAAIENETDPNARKSKLAEHRALLEKMRGQMMQQGGMMQMMCGRISRNCPAANDNKDQTRK